MRKTALGTDRRPAHCFSVQDDDELGQLESPSSFSDRSPGKGLQDVGGLCLFSAHDRMPRRDSAEARGFDFVGGALTPLSRHSANSQEGPEDLGGAQLLLSSVTSYAVTRD